MILSHLKSRHLNSDLYPNLVVDKESNTATFPLFSFDYRMVGYQQYNPNGDKKERRNPKLGKYFTYTSEPAVWGLESLFFSDLGIVFVCEGVFKSCRFHSYGYAAIATLTNNPKSLKQQILNLAPLVVAIPDPDEAGKSLSNYGHLSITPPKQIDEMSDKEFKSFLLYCLIEVQKETKIQKTLLC